MGINIISCLILVYCIFVHFFPAINCCSKYNRDIEPHSSTKYSTQSTLQIHNISTTFEQAKQTTKPQSSTNRYSEAPANFPDTTTKPQTYTNVYSEATTNFPDTTTNPQTYTDINSEATTNFLENENGNTMVI